MKKTRIIALALAAVMVMGSSLTTFAAEQNLANGENPEAVEVTYTEGAEYTVTIPKTVSLLTGTKSATYTVKVTGDISADKKVTIVPAATFAMKDQATSNAKEDVDATVEQEKTEWTLADIKANTTETGTITAEDLSAGTWKGTFNFTIGYADVANN